MSSITALRDDLIMRSMLTKVGDIPETVLLPVLRLVADDRAAVDGGWQSVIADRAPNRLLESPRASWQRRYGQFVRELEWVTGELVTVVPRDEVEELVNLILVVTPLADRRLTESDVVHISWCQRHWRSLRVCGGPVGRCGLAHTMRFQ